MTTFMYTTTSDEVHVTDEAAVENIVTDYYFPVEPTLKNGRISFFAEAKPNAAFDVYETPEQRNSVVEEFLTRLADHLKSEFEIKCVEVEGDGPPAAWKWTVTPNGTVTNTSL